MPRVGTAGAPPSSWSGPYCSACGFGRDESGEGPVRLAETCRSVLGAVARHGEGQEACGRTSLLGGRGWRSGDLPRHLRGHVPMSHVPPPPAGGRAPRQVPVYLAALSRACGTPGLWSRTEQVLLRLPPPSVTGRVVTHQCYVRLGGSEGRATLDAPRHVQTEAVTRGHLDLLAGEWTVLQRWPPGTWGTSCDHASLSRASSGPQSRLF